MQTKFETIRLKKEKYCELLYLNRGFIMSEQRVTLSTQNKNFLEGYAAVTVKFLNEKNSSTAIGILIPLMVPILLILCFIASMVIFILYLFPGFFQTRKEFVKVWKQRLFLISSCVIFLLILITSILYTIQLKQSIDEAKFSACFFYLIQYDLIAGLDETKYSFIGFNNIQTNIQAFKTELINFNSIKQNLNNIVANDFSGKKSKPLTSAMEFSKKYMDDQIIAYNLESDISESPMIVESLTTYMLPEIQAEFEELEKAATSLVYLTDYGSKIINTYKDSADVLVSSMVNVMNDIVDGFTFVIDKLLQYDGFINDFISYLEIALIMLVILSIIGILFIPVYATFYRLRNYSEKHEWTVQMMKGWLVVASVLGIIFTLFFLLFLYVNLNISAFCYYSNQVLTDTNFLTKNQNDLQIQNEKLKSIISNCFDEDKSKFSDYFNLNGQVTQNEDGTGQVDIRTKPKQTTETTTNTTTNTNTTPNTTTNTTTNTNTNTNTNGNVTVGTLIDSPIKISAQTDTTIKPVTTQTSFNTSLLSDFQSFVINFFNYQSFYENNTSLESPTIKEFYQDLINYKDGIKYNFPDYSTALSLINDLIKCNDIFVATNIRKCQTVSGCYTVKDNSVLDLSQAIAARDCVEDKSQVVNIFTSLKKSINSGETLYNQMIIDTKGDRTTETWETPGKTSTQLRSALIGVQNDIGIIKSTFNNSFAILDKYKGDLRGLTNCYITKRQTILLETPFCFILRPKLYNTMMYLALMSVLLLMMIWSVCCSVKYAGNLGMRAFGSKTTLASAWDKSKPNIVSFIDNSQIIVSSDENEENEEEYSYFSEEEEEEDEEEDIFS